MLEPRTISPGVILDRDGLVIRAFEVDHGPVSPALGYRFEYGGRRSPSPETPWSPTR
ncbi:MAG: hypothetical protein U5R48_08420 [Gammaproteobacteria bacterium]|nr:hypothetical protein [Gammaproteobacteria bacterium]